MSDFLFVILVGLALCMVGSAFLFNYRGVMSKHVERSLQSSTRFGLNPRRTAADQRRTRRMVIVLDRFVGVAMIVSGICGVVLGVRMLNSK
jgi:hypothetical protein